MRRSALTGAVPAEETVVAHDETTIVQCRNGHRLRVPRTASAIVVTCPRCKDSFEWPSRTSSFDSDVTPSQYEALVAAHYRSLGYESIRTPDTNDAGVDVFAIKGEEKLAIQAKMYGQSRRPVNREMVMQLHGAKDYFDCTKAVLVTDGRVLDTAADVARKLRIEILRLMPNDLQKHVGMASSFCDEKTEPSQPSGGEFDRIWKQYIIPLQGKTLTNSRGKTNVIRSVDWACVERITSSGRHDRIPIEVFRSAVARIYSAGSITRDEINDGYAKRGSSGIILILSQVPLFACEGNPLRLRLK